MQKLPGDCYCLFLLGQLDLRQKLLVGSESSYLCGRLRVCGIKTLMAGFLYFLGLYPSVVK